MKKHIITIAGRPGSGKSTTAKLVAERLGFQHFSTGDLFRTIGSGMGIDVLRTNRTAETNADIDRQVDERLKGIQASEDRLVIDSRLAWHFVPSSYCVFLDLTFEVAAARIIAGIDEGRVTNESIPRDPVEYSKELLQRASLEASRYKSKYGVEIFNTDNFDLVVDTAKHDIRQVSDIVVAGYVAWSKDIEP
jgi:cytidylate kinase